ncbi:hypothetical protein MSLAZ_1383 [Methanosarcina lacustris Z-7289]|uniref:GmrSD restriction endonucleases N-terminal domain-containing protein n=2 Tax=Methanosarcina lacustris TaxID=170861 RepID=A0A0E3S1N6_9EURY|nr:hypothetical protein MSLAZ_1383 [Methanosarcina lacustris Z-7289]
MLQPQNQNKKYEHLFSDIDQGYLKIPKFQRDFVWSKAQTAKLIDSIIKGFPIGTFIFWKTREELRHIRNLGNIALPETPKGDAISYVLDGQQRITSLYALRKGLRITTNDKKEIDYKDIYVNLEFEPDSDEEVVSVDKPQESSSISVYDLLNSSLVNLIKKYNDGELEKIEKYQKRLINYDFSTIVISDYPIDIACEIFTRINTSGQELTLFEIMVAKTFDQDRNFDLAKEYEKLNCSEGPEKDLKDAGFDTIPPSTVLQCISAYLCQQVRRKDILKLDKYEFIESWEIVKNGIFCAVDYIRTHLRIPVSKLLPYNALLIPYSYFFIRNGGKSPTNLQNKLLTQYFWWASLSSRFSSGAEGKIALDLKKMDDILNEIPPTYRGEELNLTLDKLKWYWFSTGDAFCKAILCLYAYFEPKSFRSNSIVKIDNSWLKVSTSKNYHHFFPKGYVKKQGIEEWKGNSILNVTIVDDYLNKREIGAKAPGDYMKKFEDRNPELHNTMKTHLIDDMELYGVWGNNYETFIEKRGERVLEEINKRIEPSL